ncbi:MAG TPA: ADOP family duplicated permease [Bryobacteraceae bacterium]|nr:ADOP family duplicated permease [Bryobacteraceae bacterium]
MSWITRIANALRPAQADAALDEELQFHLEERIAELVRSGLSRQDAERAARLRFGNRLARREESHEIKSAVWLESLLRDFRFGLRMLSKYRTTSLAAIASLALAVGACTAAFSLIDALLFRPLPVRDPRQLFDLARVFPPFMSPNNQPREFDMFSAPQFQLLRDTVRSSADLFLCDCGAGPKIPAAFDGSAGDEDVRAAYIDGHGFAILGIKPGLGRLIQPADDSVASGHKVAVLSDPFWKRRFGGSRDVLGRTFTLSGRDTFEIVGVAAPPFTGLQPGYLTDLWIPLRASVDPRLLAQDVELAGIFGRLHPGVERSQLRAPLQAAFTNALAERLRINPPRNLHGDRLKQYAAQPLILRDASTGSGRDSLFRAEFRRPFQILALICGLLLLVACSNVANLMLARASARDAEMALRISLGAARSRLVQQLLVESGQLAFLGTILALLFATFAAPAIAARLGPPELPAFLDVAPDFRSLAFAAALSLLSTLLFGLIPALRASATRPEAALKAAAMNHSGRLGPLRWMLAAQIAFSVAVLFLSGLLLLSFQKIISVDLGFKRDHVILFDLVPRDEINCRTCLSGPQLLDRIRHAPGVRAASLTAQRPMGGDMVWIMNPFIRFPGRAMEILRPREIPVSDGFFRAMQIRWISGRDFLPEEIARGSESVIVNQAFADTFLPGKDPLGAIFETTGDNPIPVRHQIVGVAGTIHYNNPREPDRPAIYAPLRDTNTATLNVRVDSTSATMIGSVRKQIEAAAPAMRIRNTVLLAAQIENTLLSERLLAMLAGFFSVVALLLAAVGLYGVIRYAAVCRTREIGIRIALGARRAAVVRRVLADSSLPVLAGIGIGIAVGLGLARYLVSQLYGVKATGFWSLATPVACILIAAISATLPPALRAANADPLIALRHE